jgi:murein DD-endopeptidase MepM/ murein hydrolase activator NlpD
LKTKSSRQAARHKPQRHRRKARAPGSGFSFVRSCGIAFALGLFSVIGIDAFTDTALPPFAEAAASTTPMTLSWAIDTDGDGIADIANPVEAGARGVDHYGSGAFGSLRDGGKRKHEGVDYVAAPGHRANAPIAGEVTRIGYAYKKDTRLQYVEIVNVQTGYSARVLYVAPSVVVGHTLAAGDEIGTVQDLSVKYPGGITNHVHVEVRDPKGVTLDSSIILPESPIIQAAMSVPLPRRDPA